jgi:23S rRNA (cytidine1920-2'-O)/16S rRNA (cytidine1409-2'-O)-methyltransferase
MTANRLRLDQALVERGLFPSRARAQGAIEAGLVTVGGRPVTKSSAPVDPQAELHVLGDTHDYVSRGGVKLAAALDAFSIDPAGLACLDLGASTGGFTEALLRAGAARVYAVDVGRGQLHPSLSAEPRVVSLEQTHAKELSRAIIPDAIDLIVCDVSFISLMKALPPALALAAPRAKVVALVKPQFEVGKSGLGKGGIVKNGEAVGPRIAREIADWLARDYGFTPLGLVESPIDGGDGNKEFLIGAHRTA